MISVKLESGEVRSVEPGELWLMRQALEAESAGTVMLRIRGERLYSTESLDVLKSRFASAGVRLVSLTAPEGSISRTVNVASVVRVEPPDPILQHANAHAVLIFPSTPEVPVQETVEEVNAKLGLTGV